MYIHVEAFVFQSHFENTHAHTDTHTHHHRKDKGLDKHLNKLLSDIGKHWSKNTTYENYEIFMTTF